VHLNSFPHAVNGLLWLDDVFEGSLTRTGLRGSDNSHFRAYGPEVASSLWINSIFRGLATITSCPCLSRKALTQGECVPTSIAIRHFGIDEKSASNWAGCRSALRRVSTRQRKRSRRRVCGVLWSLC